MGGMLLEEEELLPLEEWRECCAAFFLFPARVGEDGGVEPVEGGEGERLPSGFGEAGDVEASVEAQVSDGVPGTAGADAGAGGCSSSSGSGVPSRF
jgi:hypothetical protein